MRNNLIALLNIREIQRAKKYRCNPRAYDSCIKIQLQQANVFVKVSLGIESNDFINADSVK